MIIHGKPVRVILRGDRAAAAKWIPYFAGKCQTMGQPWEKQTGQTAEMRGWAKSLGGQGYEIYIEAQGGLRYFDLTGRFVAGSSPVQHVVDFFAWPIPQAGLNMTDLKQDRRGLWHLGSSYHLSTPKSIVGGYNQYFNTTTRIGATLFTFYSASTPGQFGSLLFQSRDVRSDQTTEGTLFYRPDLVSAGHAVYRNQVLMVRPTDEGSFANTGKIGLWRLGHDGTVLGGTTLTLADQAAVNSAGGRLSGPSLRRGASVASSDGLIRIAYLVFLELYTAANASYLTVVKITTAGEVWVTMRMPLRYPLDLDAYRTAGPIAWYVAWQGEVGSHYLLSIGVLTGVSPELRTHVYDLYVLDKDTLELAAVYQDTGITQLGAYADGCWAVGFDRAEFEATDQGRVMHIRGALKQIARGMAGGVPTFTPDRDLCDYAVNIVLDGGNTWRMDFTERNNGFIPRFTD